MKKRGKGLVMVRRFRVRGFWGLGVFCLGTRSGQRELRGDEASPLQKGFRA